MYLLRVVEKSLAALLNSTRSLARQFERSEDESIRDSERFWNNRANGDLKTIMHWRGHGRFSDDLWLSLGRQNLLLFEQAAAWAGLSRPLDRIVEWGCGGGMNAVPFACAASEYYGIDINAESLREAARQVEAEAGGDFIPVRIDAGNPEAVSEQIPGPCDLFLSTFVFELLPSSAYGLRVMRIAHDLLRPGGIAIVQIRYHTGPAAVAVSRRRYAANWVRRSTYAIDEFWGACASIGFTPLFVKLVPEMPELDEEHYAYFAMMK